MPSFFSEGNTPVRTDTQWKILQKILGATIDGGGGGGGGPATTGANYRFSGSGVSTVFSFKNEDTGLFNRVDSAGADPIVHLDVKDGTA